MDESTIREKLSRIRCFMLDMDGTFYLGANLLDGSLDFLEKLRETGRTNLFLTNNSSKSAEVYRQKLARMGVAERYRNVLTSGQAAGSWCLREMQKGWRPWRNGFASVCRLPCVIRQHRRGSRRSSCPPWPRRSPGRKSWSIRLVTMPTALRRG